jgi:hypothetical protein
LRQQLDEFEAGDILLGDKAFCGYRDICERLERGVDSVISLCRRTPIKDAQAIRTLGSDDLLIHWRRPVTMKGLTADEVRRFPCNLRLRQVKITVDNPGFRSRSIYLITTLLDAERYPADALRDLYFRRWDVELFFRDIKITMGMDILRCKSPAMVEKEVMIYFIAYNCIRYLMYEAAEEAGITVRRVSFKTSVQALRSWEAHLNHAGLGRREKFRLLSMLYESITQRPLISRPGRSEPRAVKRRPRNYNLLTKPRHQMHVPSHRNRNWTNKCKNPLS